MDINFSGLTQSLIFPIIETAEDYFCWVNEWYDGVSVDFAVAFSSGGPGKLLCKVMGRRTDKCNLNDATIIVNETIPRTRYSEIMQEVIERGAFNLVCEHVIGGTTDCDWLIGVKWQGNCNWVKIKSAIHQNPNIDMLLNQLSDYRFTIFPEMEQGTH